MKLLPHQVFIKGCEDGKTSTNVQPLHVKHIFLNTTGSNEIDDNMQKGKRKVVPGPSLFLEY